MQRNETYSLSRASRFPRVDPVELRSLFPPLYADFAGLLEKVRTRLLLSNDP
jgi:hypothetical protein